MLDKPKCTIVTGRPGAGKSTLARELGKLICMPVISRDELKEGYFNTFEVRHDELPGDCNRIVTEAFFDTVLFLLARDISLIVEAAFQHRVWRSRIDALSDVARVGIVVCSLDADTAANRHLQRGLKDPTREHYHGDKRVTAYRESGIVLPAEDYEAPKFNLPTLEVSTIDGCLPALTSVCEFIAALR